MYLIREALAGTGMRLSVHLAYDGEQAIQFLEQMDTSSDAPCPELVVLDINLPKLEGGEVLRYIRQLPKCGGTRVLVVSTSDSIEDRERMMSLGANGYFRKPSEYDKFMRLSGVVLTMLDQTPS